jgi:hypothetical protein
MKVKIVIGLFFVGLMLTLAALAIYGGGLLVSPIDSNCWTGCS